MRLPHRTSFAALFLTLIVVGCGDDDNPAAANSPCLDANTRCNGFTLPASDMAYTESYLDILPPPKTYFNGLWPTDGKAIVGYGPGRRMIVYLRFDTPLTVRYDTPMASVSVSADASPMSCFDRYVQVTPEIEVVGDWVATGPIAGMSGRCTDGSPHLDLSIAFQNLKAGQILSGVTWTFVVPDTYTSGGAAGSAILAADLDIVAVGWGSSMEGDERGNPPIWPGEFP